MIKKYSRAQRRHDRERLKKKRSTYWDYTWYLENNSLGIMLNTPARCSCYMCGNPRRYFGEVTMQEKKYKEGATIDQIIEKGWSRGFEEL